MRDILSRGGLGVLGALARSRLLLAFDFDGTLAPTVPDRDRAAMREPTRALFAEVCRLYPCAVISGRSRRDVRERLSGAAVRAVVGNHGLEPSGGLKAFARQIARVRNELSDKLAAVDGIEIEDKKYSLALHYRWASDKASARRRIRAAIARLSSRMRIVAGKLVVNVIPVGAPHKGDALSRLHALARVHKALYVGDDVTDEDVFALDGSGKVVSVRIGRASSSAASYYLRSQRDIDDFLIRLRDLRRPAASP